MNDAESSNEESSPRVPPGHARVGPFWELPRLLRQGGVDPMTLLGPLDLAPESFDHPDRTLPMEPWGRLCRGSAAELGCSHFGVLLGLHSGLDQMGAIGDLVREADTLGAALERIIRYFHLQELLLDRQCTMAEASHRLGLHRRTLNRRLEEEGTSFRTLADGARFVRAQHLMVNTDLSIGEIAFLLDYTEVSAFSHAFRRWAGVSPREWRT